jgi:hypothetical protein
MVAPCTGDVADGARAIVVSPLDDLVGVDVHARRSTVHHAHVQAGPIVDIVDGL